jgi:hypothetical protein
MEASPLSGTELLTIREAFQGSRLEDLDLAPLQVEDLLTTQPLELFIHARSGGSSQLRQLLLGHRPLNTESCGGYLAMVFSEAQQHAGKTSGHVEKEALFQAVGGAAQPLA